MQQYLMRVASMSGAALRREGPLGKPRAVIIPAVLPAPGLLKFLHLHWRNTSLPRCEEGQLVFVRVASVICVARKGTGLRENRWR